MRLKRKPSLAEIHTLSLFNLSEEERQEHLKKLLTGDSIYTEYKYDPCIEFINDVRKSNKNDISYISVKRSIGCQTLFLASDLTPSLTESKQDEPSTKPVKKTDKKETNDKQSSVLTGPHIEFQSCPDEWKSNLKLASIQNISLYSVYDKFFDHSHVNANPNRSRRSNLANGQMKNLSKSTCELTSVVKNSTDVSSKAMSKKFPEKFTLTINIPSTISNVDDGKLSNRDELFVQTQDFDRKYKRNQSESGRNGHNGSRTLSNSSNINYLNVAGSSNNNNKKRSDLPVSQDHHETFESDPKTFQIENSNYFKPATVCVDRNRAASVSKSETLTPRLQSNSTYSLSKPFSDKKYYVFNKDTFSNSIDVDDGTLIDVDFDSYNNLNGASPNSCLTDELDNDRSSGKYLRTFETESQPEEKIEVDFSIYDEDKSFHKYANEQQKVSPDFGFLKI